MLLLVVPVSPARAASDDTDLVSGWLARTLASNNDLARTPAGEIDYASTAYALLGLKSAELAADQIRASAQAMSQSKEDFIGTPDQVDSKTTAISLMILAMQAGDLDPAQYAGSSGTRNLYSELLSTIQPNGAVSTMPTAYGQSFAILALAGAPGSVPDSTKAWLMDQPCNDSSSPGFGGYGFSGPGSCDDVDPDSTALAVIALGPMNTVAVAPAETIKASRRYLVSLQDSSGGFASTFSGINANTTGLVVDALNEISPDSQEAAEGVKFLESLMYGCDSPSSLVGAIALTADTRASVSTDPLSDADQAQIFQASAQGIFGFTELGSPLAVAFGSVDVPSPSCTAAPNGTSGWWWALGGFLVVVLVYVGWRFIISGRRS